MGLRTLVVEDQLMFQELLVGMLRSQTSLGDVATAGTAAEGIAACASLRPDLLIWTLRCRMRRDSPWPRP
ncbi:MAG: response regulator [Cyanobacteria bacterium M_surface_10_m2_119]|nr:response regulator [Cyanobacteria bacterium M_surface_10_m2_119]